MIFNALRRFFFLPDILLKLITLLIIFTRKLKMIEILKLEF